MEPFFIFCLMLVVYCGYLTVCDLLLDLRRVPAKSVPEAPERPGRRVAARRAPERYRVPAAGGRAVGAFGQLASW